MVHPVMSGNDDQSAAADAAMERYADGDDAAFDELYDLLAPPLYRAMLRQTRDAERAEDLVQQTMLQLHLTRGRFQRGASVFPWAFALARRKLVDELRTARRRPAFVPLPGDGEDLVQDGGAVDDTVDARRTLGSVEEALDRLPEDQRVAFMLVRHEGVPTAEVAERLGTTANAVKLRAHRACEALRAALRALWAPEEPSVDTATPKGDLLCDRSI